ncbi:extensin-like [Papaver somniferum]|uniref:extensin-like n=1 Tax=Papaver somniferum TaxID=3469 RepID=UPI000E70148F|nr:extensin-like [Papaver somniferum]
MQRMAKRGPSDDKKHGERDFVGKEAEYKRMQRMAKRGPSDDKKHGERDFVDKKKFQQKPRNVNNNQISLPPSSVPPHQIHGGSGSSSSPFGTGMANNFRPPFGPSTSQVPQAYSGPAPQQHPPPSSMGPALQQHPRPSNMGPAPQQHPLPSNMGVTQQQHPLPSNMVWPTGPPYQQNRNGGSGSSSSPFGTGMANNFRPPFGPSTSQVPQAYSGPALQQHPPPSSMGPAPQQHPRPSNMGPAPQQHPLPSNMGVTQQQHPLPSNMVWPTGPPYQQNRNGGSGSSSSPFGTGMANNFRPPFGPSTSQVPQAYSGPAPQQHPPPSSMGPAPQQHPRPSNMGPALQQHPLPSNMGVTQQQHPLRSNMVWPNGPLYHQNAGFPMNAMPFVPYQQPQPFYHPQMFTGFSSGPAMPQHFNPSQPPILGPMPYGPSNILPGIPPAMPVFMSQPGFNQGAIQMGFQGFPPRPHMNPGEQGVPSQGSLNQTHINVGEQGVQSQGSGPLNEQNNGV